MADVHQESLLSPLFLMVVDAITKNARRDVINEVSCADDLVLKSKTMKDLKESFKIGRKQLKVRV